MFSVCLCVCAWQFVSSMLVRISPNLQLRDAVGNRDELIRVRGQKVKGQGSNETEYGQKIGEAYVANRSWKFYQINKSGAFGTKMNRSQVKGHGCSRSFQ